jgi:hypothetical protein
MGAGLPFALMVLLAPVGTLALSDAARVYARRAELDEAVAVDVDNTPRLVLGVAWPTTRLDLSYAPRLMWLDVLDERASPTLLLHAGSLQLSSRRPRSLLWLAQTVAVGDETFVGLDGAGGAGDQPIASPTQPVDDGATTPATSPDLELLPDTTAVSVAEAETSAGLSYDWSRRVASELRASVGLSGGADAEARLVLPRQRTVQIDHSLLLRLSRRDELRTALDLTQTRTSNGYDHWLASLTESWSMLFTPSSGGELALGAGTRHTTGPDALSTAEVLPVGAANAWYLLLARGLEARFQWNVGFQPHVDALAGTLQSRVDTSVQAGVTADRSSVRLELGAAQTLPPDAPDASTLLSADLVCEQRLLDWLALQLGGQILRQRARRAGPLAAAGSRWLLYAGLEGRVPEVRL